ncbi:hypothetical protein [Haloplanus litoreus]|uniref:hypothetical protein n=1 Tax=Haloplanus sp. GX21 TaxID=3127120 RepID=UPI00388F59AF
MNHVHWESANGVSEIRIHAVDERDRTFEFQVAARGHRGKLVAVDIDGVSIDPRMWDTIEALPSAITDQIATLGVTDVDTAVVDPSN